MALAAGTRELVAEAGRLVVDDEADGIPKRPGAGEEPDMFKKAVGAAWDDPDGVRAVDGIVGKR